MKTVTHNPIRRAFTLVELIVVIVVLAILSGVAIPKYFDYSAKAKESACKAALGGTREAIIHYYTYQASTNSGVGSWPSLTQLQTIGIVMQESIPPNPFNNDGTIAAATWSATPPVSGTNGWNYDASNGKFWANSTTSGENEHLW